MRNTRVLGRAVAAFFVSVWLQQPAVAADGEELYRQGDYQRAREQLEAERRDDPDDAEAALFLGLTLLRLDLPSEAAASWADYDRLAKDRKSAEEIARFRTILVREASIRDARAALAQEKQLSTAPSDPSATAIARFRNLGTPAMAPLEKAVTAMLIADLSAIPGLRILERERVETLAREAKLGGTGLVDKRTAVRAGKLLRAGRVVAGSYIDWTASPQHLRIESTVVNAGSGGEVSASSAEGMAGEFYLLIAKTSAALAAGLGHAVERLPPDVAARVQQPHTKSLPATLAFGRGLELKDRGDYPAARAEFEQALKEDPGFDLPRKELDLLPATLISLTTVANSADSLAAAASAAAGGLSLTSPAVLAGGGLLVAGAIGGGIAAAGGGGGGSGSAAPAVRTGNDPPALEGVRDVSTTVGALVSLDLTATDPEGTTVTLTITNQPAGATFNPTPGSPATASFRWTPTPNDVGPHHVTFTAADSGKPPRRRSRTADISVAAQGASTTTTIPICLVTGTSCVPADNCCSNDCAVTPAGGGTVCCEAVGKTCDARNDCCGATTDCQGNLCCVLLNDVCAQPGDCCGAALCSDGFCCLPDGAPCNGSGDCCSGSCSGTCFTSPLPVVR